MPVFARSVKQLSSSQSRRRTCEAGIEEPQPVSRQRGARRQVAQTCDSRSHRARTRPSHKSQRRLRRRPLQRGGEMKARGAPRGYDKTDAISVRVQQRTAAMARSCGACQARSTASARSDSHAGIAAGRISDREVGRRMMNAPASLDGKMEVAKAYDPYAHMNEADRQRAITEQEYRDKFEAKEVNPDQAGRGRARLHVLDRCRYRVLFLRAPRAQRRAAAGEGCRARRGADQLLPLRLPEARDRRDAVQADGHGHAEPMEPGQPARARRHQGLRLATAPSGRGRTSCS